MKRFLPIALVLSLLLTGCTGGFIRGKVESAIRKALPNYLGTAKEYVVRVDGSSTSIMRGDIRHIHVEGTDVKVDPNITVSSIVIDMDDVKYDMDAHELKHVKNAKFEAKVTEAEINSYLKNKKVAGENPTITLQQDKIVGDLNATFAGMSVGISVTGRPVIVESNKINFNAEKASVGGMPVPLSVVNKLLEKENPIYDFSKLRLPLTLEKVVIENGALTLYGHAQFPTVIAKIKN